MATPDPSTAAATAAMQAIGALWFVFAAFFLGLLALQVFMNWQIAKKAGYEGALSLLMFIPLVNVVIMLIFAFADWPVQQEVRALRAAAGVPPVAPGTGVMSTS